MANNNYQRGAVFERKVCEMLRSCGYSAARTAGSHGLYDIVAFNTERVLIIQCKTGSGRFTNEDRNELIGHAIGHGAHPVLATKDDRMPVRLTYLVDIAKPRQRKGTTNDFDLLLENSRGNVGTKRYEPSELPAVSEAATSLTRWARGEIATGPGTNEPSRS